MKLCMIGTGYVGLVSGVCLSDLGNEVICVDKDLNKINDLKKGIIPIYEPGLKELVLKNYNNKRLKFSTDLNNSIKKSDIVFICVGTPSRKNSSDADLSQIFSVAKQISKSINKFKIIKLFKDLLHRQPTSNELNDFSRKMINQTHDLDKIKRHIINTEEYIRVVKLQSNDPNPNLVYAETKKSLFAKIAEIYLTELNEEIPTNLLGQLNDIYHYLQYNEYLLRAILIHSNFENFKNELLENKKLVKNDVIKVLNKYFILKEIKDKANDIQRYDKYNKKDVNNKIHEFNNTDKYEPISNTNEEDQNLPDLKNLILQDNYNYYLWDQKTSEIDTNNFEKKLEEIKNMRQEIDKLGKETFVNFDISNIYDSLQFKNKKINNNRLELVDKKTYHKMNNSFNNIINY